MQESKLTELVITSARTDEDIEALIAVRKIVSPGVRPTVANLRHALSSSEAGLTFLVARVGGKPVGCGFVELSSAGWAAGDVAVVPEQRGQGIGSALLAEVAEQASTLGAERMQFEVRKIEKASIAFLERRGFEAVGGEEAVSLVLDGETEPPIAPEGIEIHSRSERPDVAEGMFEVYVEAVPDVPGAPTGESYESWRAREIDRPSRSPELSFVAFAGDEVVGYAVIDVRGDEGHHGFTAVKPAWRRRGIATALKQAQIEAATSMNLTRLVTGSEERNVPMRTLNHRLGYRPEPEWSTVVMEGPTEYSRERGADEVPAR
jgi:ribosomal protein S18 acetylase RimI-like enzyme